MSSPPRRYRLSSAAIGPVRLQVGDLTRSLEYYQRVLGLRAISAGPDTASLGADGDERVLVRLEARPGTRPAVPGQSLGLYHFAILLPDRPALGRFLGHVAKLAINVGMADHAVSEALYLTDPDGLGIEVYADRPRSMWRYEGEELQMTTERLDARAVFAAGSGGAWTGMPAGTVMGHLHLHVGDLDRAADFYHAGLGLDKVVWSYPGALFMSAGGYHHHLATNTWASGGPPRDDHARLLSWDIIVPTSAEASDASNSLRAAGYGVAAGEEGASVVDPWGTTLRIVAGQAS